MVEDAQISVPIETVVLAVSAERTEDAQGASSI